MLPNSGGGIVIAVGAVVGIGSWVVDTSGGGVSGGAVVLGEAVAQMVVSGGAVGCVVSLLVAQAVAASSAAIARTEMLSRCLIKIAQIVLIA